MKELLLLPIALFVVLQASGQPKEDFREILSILLDNDLLQTKLAAEQLQSHSICLVTPQDLLIEGNIGQNWTSRTGASNSYGADCLVLTSHKLEGSRARLRFIYDDYKIKAKFRKLNQKWDRTSLTIKGKGKLLIDKEF